MLRSRRRQILSICLRHGARNVRLFGSVARQEELPESDIDLLVDFETRRSLLDVVALKLDLEDLLGRPVDIGQAATLNPLVRRQVLEEAVPL